MGQCLCPRTNAKPQALCLPQGLKLPFSIRSTAERQTPLLQALRVSDQQCVIPERATVRADTAHAMASTETPKTATQLMQSGIFFFSKQTKDKLIRKKKARRVLNFPTCLLFVVCWRFKGFWSPFCLLAASAVPALAGTGCARFCPAALAPSSLLPGQTPTPRLSGAETEHGTELCQGNPSVKLPSLLKSPNPKQARSTPK